MKETFLMPFVPWFPRRHRWMNGIFWTPLETIPVVRNRWTTAIQRIAASVRSSFPGCYSTKNSPPQIALQLWSTTCGPLAKPEEQYLLLCLKIISKISSKIIISKISSKIIISKMHYPINLLPTHLLQLIQYIYSTL